MDKSVIDKIREVIEQHNIETAERIESFSVRWIVSVGGKSQIETIDLYIQK